MSTFNKPELLAPAGGMDALQAAVAAGADAVYLGASRFSARGNAQNFEGQALAEAVRHCHTRAVKVYAAINTLIGDRELPQMAQLVDQFCQLGVDGIIVQDLGAAAVLRQIAPEMPLHASTQMTVTDIDGIRLLERLGFRRAVLARELSLQQIQEICSKTTMEIEVFVHGALCACYSGQCLMSSMIGGRSANRGLCAQPCRLDYKIGRAAGSLLSPKDMCLIGHLQELKNAGVHSLKIEGRMKGPSYVSTVVSLYRTYLDNGKSVLPSDYERLNRIFFRGGLTDQYLLGKKEQLFCPKKPDNPYQKQEESIAPFQQKQLRVDFAIRAALFEPLQVTAQCGTVCISYTGEKAAEPARNLPLSRERLKAQFEKLGDTCFAPGTITIQLEEGLSLPISQINQCRRQAIERLEKQLLQQAQKPCLPYQGRICRRQAVQRLELAAEVSNLEQFFAVQDCDVLDVPLDLIEKLNAFTDKVWALLPRISPPDLEERLRRLGVQRAVVNNIGQISLLNRLEIPYRCSWALNSYNAQSALVYQSLGAQSVGLSVEMTLPQIAGIPDSVPIEAVAYGRIPLMIMEACPIKEAVGCKNASFITDRMDERFPVRCLEGCKCEILNSKPLVMYDKLEDLRSRGVNRLRLLFTTESAAECRRICTLYKTGGPLLEQSFTRGKFYKGV